MKYTVFTNAIEGFNPIRKKIILLSAIGFLNMTAYSQCPFDNAFLFDATPPCPGTFNVGCMNGGDYVSINAVNGNTYTFTTCGGTAIDTELTLYDQFGIIPLAYNDDDCGVQSTITWVSTVTGPVNLLLDEFPCSNSGACIDVEITCAPPVQSGNGCNTDVTICTPGVAGPFGFNTPGPPVSSCLDFIGPDYAYIVLYITSSGPLDLLIDGDAATGFLDVAIFDVTTGDPCTEIQNVGNEISCNYADFANGCNQFGTTFPCTSSVPAPNVVAGDVLMIVVENWSGSSTNFTLDLAPPPSAQTGPPDPTITPAGPFCDTDPAIQLNAVNMGGDWTGPGVSLTGLFDPGSVGPGTYNIDYSIGQPPCQAQSQTTITVNNCSTPCNLDNFNVNISSCQAGSLYMMSGTITYSNPPAGGTLIVEVDNGTTIYDTIINPPFTSPDNFSISGIPADGSASTITVYFSADPACTQTINYTATAPCGCSAEIGTFTANITGSSTNNYVLCFGDQIDINTNNDWVEPGEMFAPPGPPYDPGVSWLIYSCPPSVALVPNLVTDVPDDPCFLGLVSDFNLSDLNDLGMINAFPAGTFTDNIIYYVPITMYSMSNGTYSYVNTAMPCYELGAPYAVQYLPDFTFNALQDCNTSTATVTLNGGLPEIDGSNFTAGALLPVTASFANTTCTDGGTITINGLNAGDMWSFTVNDGNGCPYTVNGGPFPPSQNPAFNYPANSYCVTAGPVSPVITGVPGGTFAAAPAGLTLNAGTGQITPATSAPGSYSITYTTPGPCPDDSTVVVDIVASPVADAGPDVSICPGGNTQLSGSGPGIPGWAPAGTLSASNILDPVATPAATTTYTLTVDVGGCTGTDDVTVTVNTPPIINAGPDQLICPGAPVTLSGSGAGVGGSYAWDNGVTDGVVFNPVATQTYTVTGTDANLCTGTDQVIVTINVPDDASFNYPVNALCITAAPLSPVITGLPGGTFTSSPAGLTLDPATGQITAASSTPGTYNITYTTAGPCPDDSTVVMDIVTSPAANAGPDVSICPGTSVTLAGSGPGIPTWAPAGTLSATNILNPVATPAGTTVYTLTLDVGGCTGSDDVTVTVLNPAPIVVSPDITVCSGDCTTLTVAGGDFFEWAPDPDIADSSLTTQNVCPLITTVYDVTSYTIGSNMITNGDFSGGNSGFNSSYTFTNPTNTAEGQYNIIPNPQTYNGAFSACGDHTTGAGNMMVVNGSGTVGATVWCQTLPVTANTDYLFSAWLASVFPTNPAELQFTINGITIGGNLNASGTTCQWDEFFATWNSGAATSANICITNVNTSIAGNDFALDDISFSPVCTQTASITVTIANPDDPSFDYPLGLTYCQTSPDAVPNVTGLAGGTFSYVVTSGGPFLDLDPVTGTVSTGTSDLGTYEITYNTAGAPGSTCPQTSTLTLTITAAPVADFTFGTYCANDLDPLPTFINGGSAGVFSAAPAGLSFNTGTGLVDLSASTPGTYTVTNTINIPGCALATFDDDIVINGLPSANITGTTTICPGAPLPDVTINITAGAAPWDLTYNFNGAPVNVAVAATPFVISGAAVGSYDLVSVTDANGCTSAIVGNATISTYPVPVMNALADQEICEDGNLVVPNFGADIPGSTFAWTNVTGTDIGFGLSGNGPIAPFIATNGTGADITVTVSVTPTSPNGCVGPASTFDITIHPNPIVSFTGGPLQGCAPLLVTFDNTSTPPGANCIWTFGDGNTALGCGQVTNTYNSGTFSVSLTVTTADGCTGSASIANYVTVTENPIAEFTFSPQFIDVDMTVVDFVNSSEFADAYTWDFGDESPTVSTNNPSYTYPQVPGEYIVTLIATNSGGACADTMQQLIIIQDVIIFYVPNVFTPDHDEFNEGFHPVFTSGFDPFDYHLMIFNRWGEVVFESYDAEKGWDGTYSDQGLVQDGVYVWQIEFKETMSDKRHTHRGHVTVLK
jgi:gliding motility-associated-like protein